MDNQLWKTALHEAGHAVAFARLFPNEYIPEISIVPDYEERTAGYVKPSTDTDIVLADTPDAEAEKRFLQDATYVCAGYAAMMVFGFSEEEAVLGCDSDFERAGSFLGEGKKEALELLDKTANKFAVELIADELLQKKVLDGEQVSLLIGVADGEATQKEYYEFLELRALMNG
ncbi:hypothetical protein RXV86_09765 [Alisedimentitalea sp. MJ-SS2]|uniref:hypothetical protein n=1 Tax=Aliisedimentitalea sp. MJ-SS2 TaxID=3049795 RepID=UPI002907CA4A|nr:hypothetical protein [Alisedimentitalea sp. MJ-SS2]MDU8927670.1 hypothetical protein [Alisedimentitalea sp. MJ-SS2]